MKLWHKSDSEVCLNFTFYQPAFLFNVNVKSVYSYVIYEGLRAELDSDWTDNMTQFDLQGCQNTANDLQIWAFSMTRSFQSNCAGSQSARDKLLDRHRATLNHTNGILCQSNVSCEWNSHPSKCGINQSSEIESGEWHTKKASVRSREFLRAGQAGSKH